MCIRDRLHSGSLHPGMLELLLKLLRPCLPPTTRLRHTHDLQRNRIQDSAKTKGPAPTLHAFPYQSISKKWALFVVEVHAGGHTLRRLLPKDHDERAFAFVTAQLTRQYQPTETLDTTWDSTRGLDAFFLSCVVETLRNPSAPSSTDASELVAHVQRVLASVRAACTDQNVADVEEALAATPAHADELHHLSLIHI